MGEERCVNHQPACPRSPGETTFTCPDCDLRFGACLGSSERFPGKCDRCAQAAALFETVRGLRARTDPHPWAAFLLARRHALVWLRDEMTYIRPATVFRDNPTDGLGDEEPKK